LFLEFKENEKFSV
jgi:hypothetical protein